MNSGSEFAANIDQLVAHFTLYGTPVMIGTPPSPRCAFIVSLRGDQAVVCWRTRCWAWRWAMPASSF
jgi:hypothetical protein